MTKKRIPPDNAAELEMFDRMRREYEFIPKSAVKANGRLLGPPYDAELRWNGRQYLLKDGFKTREAAKKHAEKKSCGYVYMDARRRSALDRC